MMEESGRVRDAFLKRGHDAISCDILPTSSPGPHSRLHWWEFLEKWPRWDLMICHPPCTFLTVAGNKWYYHPDDKHLPMEERRPHPQYPDRLHDRKKAIKVCEALFGQKQIPRICLENPIGRLVTLSKLGKPTQIIQPWQFGHGETKATCFWLKGLEPLKPTNIVAGREQRIFNMSPGPQRAVERSKTFLGVAAAMAEQWG